MNADKVEKVTVHSVTSNLFDSIFSYPAILFQAPPFSADTSLRIPAFASQEAFIWSMQP